MPNLTGYKGSLALDTETDGLAIWGRSKPVGLSIATEDGFSWYLPWAHEQGFNFEFNNVAAWCKDNLAGKEILAANAKFDLEMVRKVGIDLEALGCTIRDVMHCPALLFSNRKDYSLDAMSIEFLAKAKIDIGDKVKYPIHTRDSASIQEYACQDALLVQDLNSYFTPIIEKKELTAVRNLEDSIIFAVSRMERQGVRIDVDRMEIWIRQIQARYIKIVLEIYDLTQMRVEPTKSSHLQRLFHVLKIKSAGLTKGGAQSYAIEFMQEFAHIPAVKRCIEAKQLMSVKSKLESYLESVGPGNIVRYALNQLKATNDEGVKGAVTGRFSSSGGGKGINGINIQQVFDDEKQEKIPAIADFPIRDLFIPADGMDWLSADARQIEFRIFAHFSNSDRLLRAYRDDPLVDFHTYVANNILHVPRDKKLKNMNFGKMYMMGVQKLADIYLHCSYDEAKEKSDHYDREFPEAKELGKLALNLAKSRGYVKTILGRRREYTKADMKFNPVKGISEIPYHSALPAVISGSAADIMKRKIKELDDARNQTQFNMRFTVHDEVDGDVPKDPKHAKMISEILDTQSTPLRVPILWEIMTGSSWMKLEKLK